MSKEEKVKEEATRDEVLGGANVNEHSSCNYRNLKFCVCKHEHGEGESIHYSTENCYLKYMHPQSYTGPIFQQLSEQKL